MRSRPQSLLLGIIAFALAACGPVGPEGEPDGGVVVTAPFAADVVDYLVGEGGGYGEADLPDVVLGEPKGGGPNLGSRDVFSLGIGGSITVLFDPPCPNVFGPDFIVFENAFRFGPVGVFTEPGVVAVAAGVDDAFVSFPCSPDAEAPNGCAGMTPVLAGPTSDIDATNVDTAGGDSFDIDTLVADGLLDVESVTAGISLVRITDVGGIVGDDGTSGFDLDAIVCVGQ